MALTKVLTGGIALDAVDNTILKLDDNNVVQISKCPNDHGKIKSPLCCGQDMSCNV